MQFLNVTLLHMTLYSSSDTTFSNKNSKLSLSKIGNIFCFLAAELLYHVESHCSFFGPAKTRRNL